MRLRTAVRCGVYDSSCVKGRVNRCGASMAKVLTTSVGHCSGAGRLLCESLFGDHLHRAKMTVSPTTSLQQRRCSAIRTNHWKLFLSDQADLYWAT